VLALDRPGALQAASVGQIVEVVASPPRQALRALRGQLGDDRVQLFGDRLHVRTDRATDPAAIGGLLKDTGVEVTSTRRITPTLEDVFIEKLGEQHDAAN
jgi:hypothetical protein